MTTSDDGGSRAGLSRVFGRLHWERPAWVRRFGAYRREKPGRTAGGFLLGLLLLSLVVGGSWYYLSLPEPARIQVTMDKPGVTPIVNDEPRPEALVLRFRQPAGLEGVTAGSSASVARLDLVDETVPSGVSLEPAHAGEWHWSGDDTLVFEPDDDWPAGQRYRITIEPSVLADGVRLAPDAIEFETPQLEAKLEELRFYQHPEEIEVRRVVATLNFSHAVDADSLEEQVALSLRGEEETIDSDPRAYGFEIELDRHGRRAHVHSESIEIPRHEAFMRFTLAAGLRPAAGPSRTEDSLSDRVRIPDVSTFFRVDDMEARIVRDERGEPDQVLILEFSDAVSAEAVAEYLTFYRLPRKRRPNQRATGIGHHWRVGEVDAEVLDRATALALDPLPLERDPSMVHSFRFDAPDAGYLFVGVRSGMESRGGFPLVEDAAEILRVPEYPQEVGLRVEGAVMSRSGSRQLGLEARGLKAMQVRIGRLLPEQVNHLVSQTRGDFQNPRFMGHWFDEDNITDVDTRLIPLAPDHPGKAVHASLDLGRYLQEDASGEMFFVAVQGWDPDNDRPVHRVSDRRFILVTDLGLVVKANADGAHEVFVADLGDGAAAEGAQVQLLGSNGLPIQSGRTDANGRVSFPDASDYRDEQVPTVYVAQHRGDTAFIPYQARDRQLGLSRFDVGGVHTRGRDAADRLSAHVFSDRGIYRPGEEVHLAAMVKRRDWANVADLPLEVHIHNPRRELVMDHRLSLPDDGFFDFHFETEPHSPTGDYRARVFLLEQTDAGHTRRTQIGEAGFSVEEFQPDRMRLEARVGESHRAGWLSPEEAVLHVDLANLFGAPAENRRVTGTMHLNAGSFRFREYEGYRFSGPGPGPNAGPDSESASRSSRTAELSETRTDAEGQARLPLPLDEIAATTWTVNASVRAFEGDGGRSVTAVASHRVSPLSRLVGYRLDGDTRYIREGGERELSLIAVNRDLQPVEVSDARWQLVEKEPVSTLVQQRDGTYAYQRVTRETVVNEQELAISEAGHQLMLPTDTLGDFELRVLDDRQRQVAAIPYSVVVEGSRPTGAERPGELDVKLAREDVAAGEALEMQITAPYTGLGLITVEREQVYTHQWFRADSHRSVQSIRVPEELDGNAYVHVLFVRAPDSTEVFSNPLSYAVAPFNIDRDRRTVGITLSAAERVEPGRDLVIEASSDRPSRMVVFAVDEGILQVANYQTPDPLGHFLRKQALEVGTRQILDQMLPDMAVLRQVSAPGGDARRLAEAALAAQLNPFARAVEAPMAYWSGLVEAGPEGRELRVPVPDHFNGELRLMAVAAAPGAAGSAEARTVVRAPLIITPHVPTMVAPGDEFVVAANLSNQLEGSGEAAPVSVELVTDGQLEVLGSAERELTLDEGREDLVRFRVRALAEPGAAELRFNARLEDRTVARTATLSVRPATPYQTRVRAGIGRDEVEVPFEAGLLEAFREETAAASRSPLILADGMQRYLNDFPHACTEQLVSKLFPGLALMEHPFYRGDVTAFHDRFERLIGQLRRRQMSNGGFVFWPGAAAAEAFASVYVMDFLQAARNRGLPVPGDMYRRGQQYLRAIAGRPGNDLDHARLRAYAVYLLTRDGQVTTGYLNDLHEGLDPARESEWGEDLAAVYMAASYQLMRQAGLARQLIGHYRPGESAPTTPGDFQQSLGWDARYLTVLARHFPDRLAVIDAGILEEIVQPVLDGQFNTLSAAYLMEALAAYDARVSREDAPGIRISGRPVEGEETPLGEVADPVRFALPADLQTILFEAIDGGRFFHSVTRAGFDREPPARAMQSGMEIHREYRNAEGEPVTEARQGDELTVHIRVRSLGGTRHDNVAIVDLMPGGFEVQRDSLREGPGGWNADYQDIREDRVVFYGSVEESVRTLSYQVRVTAAGDFVVPPAYAEAMYWPRVRARSTPGRFMVVNPQADEDLP